MEGGVEPPHSRRETRARFRCDKFDVHCAVRVWYAIQQELAAKGVARSRGDEIIEDFEFHDGRQRADHVALVGDGQHRLGHAQGLRALG